MICFVMPPLQITPHVQHLVKGEYHTMVNIDLDTCKVDPVMSENAIVRTIAKESTKFINFSLMCPYNPVSDPLKKCIYSATIKTINFHSVTCHFPGTLFVKRLYARFGKPAAEADSERQV